MEFHADKYRYVNTQTMNVAGVGPVGDPNTYIRMRRSSSEMTPIFRGRASTGSNIVDGNNTNMYRVGARARVYSDETMPRPHMMQHGVKMTDIVPAERVFIAIPSVVLQQSTSERRRQVFQDQNLSMFNRVPRGFAPIPGEMRRDRIPRETLIEPF